MEQKHLSLLNEGMTSDVHPSLQPLNTYRDARNGNLISHDGNNYSFESTEGTVLNWTMPEHKSGAGKFVPIGWFRLGNRLIVHSTDNTSVIGGDGEIGIVTFNNAGVGTYEAMYYHSDLLYTQLHMIFGYGLEENDNFHRSYWTDNFNQPRTINTASDVFTTEYASGSLVVGEQYMVLTNSTGSIEHPLASGNIYGPKQVLNNVFTASTTTYTPTGDVKVIKFLSPNILNYTPERMQGSIDFLKYVFGGAVYCGVKLYAYRLTVEGYATGWSFTTNPIHVGPNNPATSYVDYQGGGYNSLVNSGKGVQLTISDIPSDFDRIEVAVVEMDQDYEVVRNIEIFWSSNITGTSMTITHLGQENLFPVTLDDLQLRSAVILKCKDLATLKQRQTPVNLTERPEIDFDATQATISPFTYEIPCEVRGVDTSTYVVEAPFSPSTGTGSGYIHPGGHYVARGDSVTYNAVLYPVGEPFIGVPGVTGYTATSASTVVKCCIAIKNYDKFAGGASYKVIDLEDEFFDYKSMASHCYLKGYWRAETYRFGLLAWDKFGNPYAVRYIDDILMPTQSVSGGAYKLMNKYNSDTKFTLNALGVEVDNIDITDIKDQISAISIVRVPRDKTILGQGMIMQTVEKDGETNVAVPISTYSPHIDHNAANNNSTLGYTWTILGPEFDFGLSAFPIPLISGDKLSPVADYEPLTVTGQAMVKVGPDQEVYSKYYGHNEWNGASQDIGLVRTLEAGEIFDYVSGGFAYTFKNHDIGTSGSHPAAYGGGAGTMEFKSAVGGRRTLILTNLADFVNPANGNTGTGYDFASNPAGSTTNRKLLANYLRPKSSLYGGTGDAALANNKYIFTGHYQKIDATVLADIVDGSGRYILNGVQVFGGDCFVTLYDRVSSMYDENYADPGGGGYLDDGSYSWGVVFPVESNVNTGLREGRHYTRDGMHNEANGVYGTLTVGNAPDEHREDYQYNASYSSENDKIQYDALPLNFNSTARFPYRARYSNVKFLGENIDNMRIFLVNNYRDVDALHGEINNAAVGFDRLFIWQDKGITYLPINERETTVSPLGGAVQLGVGGVMDRYDTLDKFYGNQHQASLIIGEDFFMWFDMRRKAVMRMTFNGGVVDVSIVKGLSTFFQNVFHVAEPDDNNILNIDQPIIGQGIIGVYDPIKKTAYHTFKFSSTEYGPSGDLLRNRDFTIGISSTLGKFVGFFDFTPVNYIEHNSRVYAVKKTRQGILPLTSYTVGMEVVENGSSYVCIQDFTTTDPINGDQLPTSLIYWKKTGQENEIHRMFVGDICKYFGIVYPWSISIPINPILESQKTFDAGEAYGNPVAFTDVFCNTESLSSSDTNISATNKNYKYYDGRWNFNYPLAARGQRLTDQYMIIKLQVKNYLTDITLSTNTQKRLVYLKTLFRPRK